MRIVKFPEMALEFELPKVAFQIFGVDIHCYAVCIVLGILVALFLCKQSEEKFYISFENVVECTIIGLIAGVIGARIYYVLFNFEQYATSDILEIFNIRDGGLAIYGGLLAGGYVMMKRCKECKIKPEEFFDYIVPFVAIAQCIGRFGNFFNLEAYGIETESFFRMGIQTINGYKEVHPVFFYESLATFIIFLILRHMQKDRKFIGQICYTYILLYSGVRMLLEMLRVDSLMFFGFKISIVLSVVLFIYSGVIIIKRYTEYAIRDSHKPLDLNKTNNMSNSRRK